MEPVRGSYHRTTIKQLECYLEFVRRHPEIQCRKNSHSNPAKIDKLWNRLAEILNGLKGPTRTAQKWKESLKHWKNQLFSRSRKNKTERELNGELFDAEDTINSFEQRALETFRAITEHGSVIDLPAEIESDVQTYNETQLEVAQENTTSIEQIELNESQTEILQEHTRYNRGKEEDENRSQQFTVKDIKRKAHPEEYVAIKKQSSNSSKRDEFDVFGEYVAYTLRNLERKSIQSRAKFEISNILYRAEVYDDDQQPCAFSGAFTSNPASSVDTAQLSSGTWDK